jgi:anti-sigma factor RsiW
MVDQDSPVTEDELHAHVDGELPAERRGAVEAWLAAHADDAAHVAAWRSQMEQLRARYGAVASEPVPARLALDRLPRDRRLWIAAAAAMIATFLVGGLTGWAARGATAAAVPTGYEAFAADALDAYKLYVVEVRHPVEVPGSESAHLVQWLSKRVGYQLRAPDLERIGLKLVGGRLLPGPIGAAAFFMYESTSGERFTLYCARANAPDTALRYQAVEQVGAFYWIDQDQAYAVSGEADRDRLRNVASAAYEQIDTRTAPKQGS